MNGTAHKIGGILAGIGLSYGLKLTIPLSIITIILTIIGASIPDIDRILPLFTHRGIVHTLVGAAFFTIACKLILLHLNVTIALEMALLVGYVSHLILDTFTHMGIMWMYPITRVRI